MTEVMNVQMYIFSNVHSFVQMYKDLGTAEEISNELFSYELKNPKWFFFFTKKEEILGSNMTFDLSLIHQQVQSNKWMHKICLITHRRMFRLHLADHNII